MKGNLDGDQTKRETLENPYLTGFLRFPCKNMLDPANRLGTFRKPLLYPSELQAHDLQ